MHWSYKIFRVFGIDVRVHATFLFIVAYFAVVWGALREPGGVGGALYGVMLVVLLFVLVVIHEVSHSRVAQSYGVRVISITLLPIGGISQMDEMPEDPKKELAISIAGPLSNVIIALVMAAVAPLFIPWADLTNWSRVTDLLFEQSARGAYLYLGFVNISLAVFNLLPAFPMDGGRVFRSVLALSLGRTRATRAAVRVGQVFAVLMGLGGILSGQIFLILIAIFIYFGAQTEAGGDDVRKVLAELRVGDAMNTEIHVASPDQTIGELASRLFHSYQEDFPVVDADGRVVGIVTRDKLIAALGKFGPEHAVSEVMHRDFPSSEPDEGVYAAFMRMREGGLKAMPVMDGLRLVGMVSVENISEVYAALSAAGPDIWRRISKPAA